MSKKGPRSDAFLALTASLSEEVIERYIDIAREVRDKELARRREAERRKAAERRARIALLKSLGLLPPGWGKKKKGKKGKKARVSGTTGEARGRGGAAGRKEASSREDAPGSAPHELEPGALPPKANPGQGKKPKPITREDILKLAIADELGYLETVRQDGWGGLTSAQSGRVGGTMTRRMKRLKKGLPPV